MGLGISWKGGDVQNGSGYLIKDSVYPRQYGRPRRHPSIYGQSIDGESVKDTPVNEQFGEKTRSN